MNKEEKDFINQGGKDTLKELGPISKEEHDYYENLPEQMINKEIIKEFEKIIQVEDSKPDEYTGKIDGIEEDYFYTITKLREFLIDTLVSQRKEIIEKLEYVLEEDNWAKDGTTLHDRILKIIKDEPK